MKSNVGRRSGPKSRTSCYLGVTQYKRTGRWEAHIWLPGQKGIKGQQLHLGSFPNAEAAALAYDRAATRLKIGAADSINLHNKDYTRDEFLNKTGHLDHQAFISELRKLGQAESTKRAVSRRHRRKPGHRNDINVSLFANSNNFQSYVHQDPNNLKSTSSDKIPLHILELQALASNKNMNMHL